MQDHPSLVALPDAYVALFPQLAKLELPHEHRATCEDCVQVPPPGQEPDGMRPFARDLKCCTYRPALPNFLVGRALAREDLGSDKIRARILRFREGVSAAGVRPPAHFRDIYTDSTFGREPRLRCPYWTDGDLSCTIWRDRNAVCRTWFCKMTDGPRSAMLWKTVRDALTALETRLAQHLVETGDPPDVHAPPEAWFAWFIDCHERLEGLSEAQLGAVDLPEREGLALALKVYGHLHEAPVPDVVFPTITAAVPSGDHLHLHGFSRLDVVEVPRSFMALFGQLVAGVPWRQAITQVQASAGLVFDDAFIERLWRRGIVTWPLDAEQSPELQAWLDLCEAEGLERPGAVHDPMPELKA